MCVCVCVKGEHNVYLNQHLAIIPNTKIKNNIHIQLFYKKEIKRLKKGRKNMKKNHINFAHPNKWPNSLTSPMESPSIVIEIAMGRQTKN